jgi:exonuclease III
MNKKIQRDRKTRKCQTLKIYSVNAASLKPKLHCHIETLNIAVFAIQETHAENKSHYDGNFENYYVFEAVSKSKKKGGTLIGAHKFMNPSATTEFELLVL